MFLLVYQFFLGPLLRENLDVRRIPISLERELTIALSCGDQWKLVAEKLGFTPPEIRFLDKRTLNPAEALIGYIANQRYLSVGELYDVLCDCDLPVVADLL
ncbi:unnamed protein product [Porites lobata]|uniref:Death domain-containing protein n=1 Tax=Porites lobata TaxID=104759 RepID=A0ABN8NNM3_9CNID|nr:unnamed protein product [Porites lobata]